MMDGKPFEVVGVVHYEGLRAGGATANPYLFCAATGRGQQTTPLRRGVRGDVPNNQAAPPTSVLEDHQSDVRIAMVLLSFNGAVALLLTTLGLYGVVALWVGQRTREIGIRVALGARSAGIVALVLREGLRLVLIGLPLGL